MEDKRKEIVRIVRWMGLSIFNGSMGSAWDKLYSRVFLNNGVRIESKKGAFRDLTDEQVEMVYKASKELQKMYNLVIEEKYA